MQNVVFNMCEKFQNDRLRDDRSLGSRNSDYNDNVRSAWRPFSGSEKSRLFRTRLGYLVYIISTRFHLTQYHIHYTSN